MEEYTSCHICDKITKLYQCECGSFLCKYHKHIILHQCPIKYPIMHVLFVKENYNACYVCYKKEQLFDCFCEGKFCMEHINAHYCTFKRLKTVSWKRLMQEVGEYEI